MEKYQINRGRAEPRLGGSGKRRMPGRERTRIGREMGTRQVAGEVRRRTEVKR